MPTNSIIQIVPGNTRSQLVTPGWRSRNATRHRTASVVNTSRAGGALRREEVIPSLRIVVCVVRPHHPVHDIAPPLAEGAGVSPADRPPLLRLLALTSEVPPLVVVEAPLWIGLLASFQVRFASSSGRVVSLGRHLRAPPTLEAEIHVVDSRLEVWGILRYSDSVEPGREAFLGEGVLADHALLLYILHHGVPGVGQPDLAGGQHVDALPVVFPDSPELPLTLPFDEEVDDDVQFLARHVVASLNWGQVVLLHVTSAPTRGQ